LTSIEKRVLYWEKHLLDPEVRAKPEEHSSYLSEVFIEITMNGQKYSKAEIIELVTKSRETQYKIRNSKVSLLSDEIAMLLFDCLVTSGSSGPQNLTRRCSIWQQFGSEWKLTFHQGTPVLPL
tara:strand:+ start:80 stop:448 length:369 start_codon:yes stop_codon:yes gene_type:complete